jgi:hypothetical protein
VPQTAGGLDLACATSRTPAVLTAPVDAAVVARNDGSTGSGTGTCIPNTACNLHANAGFGEGDVTIDSYYTEISVSAVNATVSISLESADFSATTACFLEDPVGTTGAFVLAQAVDKMAVAGSASGTISAKLRCYNYVSDRVTQLVLQRFGCFTVTETVTWFKTRLNTPFFRQEAHP